MRGVLTRCGCLGVRMKRFSGVTGRSSAPRLPNTRTAWLWRWRTQPSPISSVVTSSGLASSPNRRSGSCRGTGSPTTGSGVSSLRAGDGRARRRGSPQPWSAGVAHAGCPGPPALLSWAAGRCAAVDGTRRTSWRHPGRGVVGGGGPQRPLVARRAVATEESDREGRSRTR